MKPIEEKLKELSDCKARIDTIQSEIISGLSKIDPDFLACEGQLARATYIKE